MQTLAPHQQRVVAEHRDLTEKITKLDEFIRGDVFTTLPNDEQSRLSRQLSFMRGYANTLSDRIAAFVGEKIERVLSFGERAVGLTFNPGNNPAVDECKRLYAAIIDTQREIWENAQDPEVKRLASIAITEAQTAQMWAVKSLTWKVTT